MPILLLVTRARTGERPGRLLGVPVVTSACRDPRRGGSHAAASAEAPETSGATTGGLLRYVRTVGGDEAVRRVLALAGTTATPDELDDQSRWWSYDTRIRLFAAATEVLGDPRTMYEVGASALQSGLAPLPRPRCCARWARPRQVFGKLPRAVQKFSTTSTMEILETGRDDGDHPLPAARRLPALPAGLPLRPGPAEHRPA